MGETDGVCELIEGVGVRDGESDKESVEVRDVAEDGGTEEEVDVSELDELKTMVSDGEKLQEMQNRGDE